MTDQPHANPPPPPAHHSALKPGKMGPTMRGFIVTPFILVLLFELNDIAAASHSSWIRFLPPIVFFIAVFVGLLFRTTRHFSIGALLFVGVVLLVFFSFWGINRLTTMI